jgi:SAM-dependent MidA family methyltransferase
MEVALYHPRYGYYRRARDPFGKHGDYYTAEQLQPVFGILIAARLDRLRQEMGNPREFAVLELGAGRGEMAGALGWFRYIPVDVGSGQMPGEMTGVVFSNEFFDALPVDAAVRHGSEFIEMRVGWRDGRFIWVEGEPLEGERGDYAGRYLAEAPDGAWVEIGLAALEWLDRIAACLRKGFVVTIDYGYNARELQRHPAGTLMSYWRHTAGEDVLLEPGERDITSHVCFSALRDHGARLGLKTVRMEMLAQTLLEAGEADQFASALGGAEQQRLLQLKSLLFDFGETHRTLIQRKEGGQ